MLGKEESTEGLEITRAEVSEGRRSEFLIKCKVFPGFVSGEYGVLIEFDGERLFVFAPESDVVVGADQVRPGEYVPGELRVPVLKHGQNFVTIQLPQESTNTGERIDIPVELVSQT